MRWLIGSGEDGEDEEMSPEEANMMEMENEKLIDHLSSLTNHTLKIQIST